MGSGKPSDGVQPSLEHTTGSSIQDLPTELLITIISLASKMEPDNLTRTQWLSTVCPRWRTVVEETPEIWSYITGYDPPKIVKKAIEKSKYMSLEIDYHIKAHGADQTWTLPLQRVLSVLRMTSKLEKFTYGGGLSQALGGDNETIARGSILLPAVKCLQLYSESSGALEILKYIRVPACMDISLKATLGDLNDPETSAQMYEGIIQFLPRIIHLKNGGNRNGGNRVQIKARPAAACFSISTVEFDLSHHTQVSRVRKWMVEDLADESMEIDLSIEDFSFTAEQLDSLIPPSLNRQVSKLSIGRLGDQIYQAGSILQYLSRPKLESGGQVRWPLPHLRELAVLNHSPDLRGTLGMLQARAQAINSPAAFRLPQVLKLVLEGGIIDSEGNVDLISGINEFLQENGGELWRRDRGKEPVRYFFS
ncbi:hypothetical protein FS837_004655 [Tulasnella sp. UAMH 9824]|nr:hypothetical protein FS837_004655 [Tulasnella sp. UAMH 9824]